MNNRSNSSQTAPDTDWAVVAREAVSALQALDHSLRETDPEAWAKQFARTRDRFEELTQEAPAADKAPAAADKEPAADKAPAAADIESAAGDNEPSAAKEEPSAASEEPPAAEQAPAPVEEPPALDAASLRQAMLTEQLESAGYGTLLGRILIVNEEPTTRPLAVVPHRDGLPEFDLVVAPSEGAAAGAHGIFIGTNSVTLATASAPVDSHPWRVVQTAQFTDADGLLALLSTMTSADSAN